MKLPGKLYQNNNAVRMVDVPIALRALRPSTIRTVEASLFERTAELGSVVVKCEHKQCSKRCFLYQNYTAVLYQNKNALDRRLGGFTLHINLSTRYTLLILVNVGADLCVCPNIGRTHRFAPTVFIIGGDWW